MSKVEQLQQTPKVSIEAWPFATKYHLRGKITGVDGILFSESSTIPEGWLRRLVEIPGVDHITVSPYSFSVFLAKCYGLEEVEPAVLAIIAEGHYSVPCESLLIEHETAGG